MVCHRGGGYGLGDSAVQGAFNTALHRGIPLERLASANPIESLKEIDQAITAHGESPELLLLQSQQTAQADLSATGKEEKPASAPELPNSEDILRKIVAKWPGFAPAYRELARKLASDESSVEEAIALFEKYTTLVPFDPRPWEELGAVYEEKKRLDDAEKALRQFVQLDPENPAASIKLASFLAARGRDQDASKSVAAAFERGGQVNEALGSLEEEVYYNGRPEEEEARFIQVLLAFAKQLEKSARGLRLLAHCQNESGLHAEASETIKRMPANEKTSWDYSSMALYLRAAHQYQAALDAGDESVKIEADLAQAHFERACSARPHTRSSGGDQESDRIGGRRGVQFGRFRPQTARDHAGIQSAGGEERKIK